MKLTENSLKNPAAVIVVAAMALVVGIVMLTKLPVQLLPAIERPQLTVQTSWRAASPSEIESEIVEPVEEVMLGLRGMEDMQSISFPGFGAVTLNFSLETDMNQAMLDVISNLNRLRPLPADADRPQVIKGGAFGGGQADQMLIFLFAQVRSESGLRESEYAAFMEDQVIPQLESVPGVADVILQASSGEQLQIEFDPVRLAQFGISPADISRLVGRTTDISGGYMEVGRRSYMLNFQGRYEPEELRALILEWRNGSPVTLGDVADVRVGLPKRNQVTYQNGSPAMGLRVLRESGANVLATIGALTEKIEELNEGVLSQKGIKIEKSFDPSVFINRAITLLSSNLLIGVLLAIAVLWWFLRQVRATLLIALTIPICLATTMIVLAAFGRTVNIISLAGLAFATGMVLDAAIVVLENIVRLREKGEKSGIASLLGANQVTGALVASTATTVAIFVPILFLKDVEGQLFADLALTIAIGVAISLMVAITILPVAAQHWLKELPVAEGNNDGSSPFVRKLMVLTGTPVRRISLIAGLMAGSLLLSWALLPNLNYLPPVKRDAVDAFISVPSGANTETLDRELAQVVLQRMEPYLDGTKEPEVKNYYFFSFPGGGGANLGVRVKDVARADEMMGIMQREILADFPDVRAFAFRGSLFGGFGGNANVTLNIHATDLDGVKDAVQQTMGFISEALPGAQTQINPDPNVITPELKVVPNDRRLAEVGFTRGDISRIVRTFGDGLWLGEHFDGEKRVDMILKSYDLSDPEMLESVPVATPRGGIVPLGELVTITRGIGPAQVQRIDRRRTVSFGISQPDGMTLEDMVSILKEQVEPKVKPLLPLDATISYGGSADALERAVASLSMNFVIALGLLFMLLAALFKSPKDAFLVVVTIPLASMGGVVALWLLNLFTFAPLDLLTMIGFIILLGLVVNNAILLVAQTRTGEEEGLTRDEAVERALSLRLRPIFMSTLTSLMGMLPLVLFPGAGSEIYRGMATTIVGGMAVSTIFTLVLLPCLLRLGSARKTDEQSENRALQPAE